jgi:hypothetical protein
MLHKGIGWSPMRTATWQRDRAPMREAIRELSRACPTCQGQRMVHTPFMESSHLLPLVCPTCGGRGTR